MSTGSLVEEQTLLAVLDTGSFGAAAQALGISQSSVSRRIAMLEERLGGKALIARTTRKVHLTKLGLAYAIEVRSALNALHEAEQMVLADDNRPRGLVRLSLPHTLGQLRFLPALNKLIKDHGGLDFEIEFHDTHVDLYNDMLDISVRLLPSEAAGVKETVLGTTTLIPVASVDYMKNHQPVLTSETALNYEYVMPNLRLQHLLTGGLSKKLGIDLSERVRIRTNTQIAMHSLVNEGAGICVLPIFLVKNDLESGRLIQLKTDFEPLKIDIYCIYKHHLANDPKIITTIEALKASMADIE